MREETVSLRSMPELHGVWAPVSQALFKEYFSC